MNLSLLLATAVPGATAAGADLPDLWQARLRSVVAVDYTVADEISPHVVTGFGVAIDRQGTIVLPWEAVDSTVPVSQLQHFQVYLPGETDGHSATYLGSVAYSGSHYIRVGPSVAPELVPITHWLRNGNSLGLFVGVSEGQAFQAAMKVGEPVWGIGLRSKEEGFAPYLLMSHVALKQGYPHSLCITQETAAGPGLPVFDEQGDWVGLAADAFGQTYLEYSRRQPSGEPIMLLNLEESSAFVWSQAVAHGFLSLPSDPNGRPIAWAGALGLVGDADGTLLVQDVGPNSPASSAGLRSGDYIVSVDGIATPRIVPAKLEVEALEQQIQSSKPGDKLALVVRRDDVEADIMIVLADAPKLVREARRRYFSGPGVVLREPVAADGGGDGAVVVELASDGPATRGGLRANDRIAAIDGVAAGSFFETAGRLATANGEVALSVQRAGESAPITLHVHWAR